MLSVRPAQPFEVGGCAKVEEMKEKERIIVRAPATSQPFGPILTANSDQGHCAPFGFNGKDK